VARKQRRESKTKMGRILAIDWGTKRTGIAVTDPLRIVAGSLATVPTHELKQWLAQYLASEKVDIIVVGRPMQMNGQPSETMAHIEPLVERLRTDHPDQQVVTHDERFTSKLAQRAIIDGGVGKMARRDKALVDRVSATIILQSYMESREYKGL
jgi:putative Holliday junction resolvase